MNALEQIFQILEPFGYPRFPDRYEGEAKRYFTYNYAADTGTLFGDDAPEGTIASMQVHFFLPMEDNFVKIKNEIRKALFKGGFTFPEVTILVENSIRHIIFECEIEEMEE